MRIGDSFGMVAVFGSLLMVHCVLMTEYGDSRGTRVLLPHRCTPQENMHRGDRREVLVRYQFDRSSFVNNTFLPVEGDLRREIAGVMSTRQEQVLSFSADERLTYGEVTSVLSDLRRDDPELFIALVTKDQVDGMQGPQAALCLQ